MNSTHLVEPLTDSSDRSRRLDWRWSDGAAPLLEKWAADQSTIQQNLCSIPLADGSVRRVFDAGEGEPIVFLPTISAINFVYAPQLDRFSEDHRVIAYEPRESLTEFISIDDRVRELVDLLDALDLESAHLAAYSDGGSVAYRMAHLFPKRVRSLVFMSLPDRYVIPQPFGFMARLLRFLPLDRVTPSWVEAMMVGLFFRGPKVPFRDVAALARGIPNLGRLFRHSALSLMLDHDAQRGEPQGPALVLCGEHDPLVSIQQADRLARLLPGAGAPEVVPHGEKLLCYVNGAEVNERMASFYERLGRAR